jgi:hypothetical protein
MVAKKKYSISLPAKETDVVREFCAEIGVSFSGLLSQLMIGMHSEITGGKGLFSKSWRDWTMKEKDDFMQALTDRDPRVINRKVG